MVEIRETENDIPKDILELAVDSGTEVHVIPFKWVNKLMKWVRGPEMIMRGAGGEFLKHYGRVEVLLEVDGRLVRVHLEVADARRALLSVSAMVDAGWQVNFDNQHPMIMNGEKSVTLTRKRGL